MHRFRTGKRFSGDNSYAIRNLSNVYRRIHIPVDGTRHIKRTFRSIDKRHNDGRRNELLGNRLLR
jgi:hypothetical protein